MFLGPEWVQDERDAWCNAVEVNQAMDQFRSTPMKSSMIDRRAFLFSSACAASAAFVGCRTDGRAGQTAEPPVMPCAPTQWRKRGVVLEATEPWEGSHVQNFTTCAEPLGRGAWRLWYSVSDRQQGYNLAYAEGIPGEHLRKVPAVCSPREPADAPLAIGHLPEGWKPVQGVHLRLRHGRHRLYFWVHGPQVVRYLVAESVDGHRYRVVDPLRPILYHPSDRAAFGVPSPDGLLVHPEKNSHRPADEPLAIGRLISNDATNIYQLADGTFEMYSVALLRVAKTDAAYVAEDNAPGLIRIVDRYTSADGLRFENRRRVIQCDASDPPDQQFYYLSVTHTPKGRVGMLGHYRCQAQTMDLEWCFSPDGLEWQRLARSAWLPRGLPPEPDCYGIYAGHQLVEDGGNWHLFYTGANSSHNGRQSYGKARQVVLWATTDSIWAD
jgi:hypothetical protein